MRELLSGLNLLRRSNFSLNKKFELFFQRYRIYLKSKNSSENNEKIKSSRVLNYNIYSYRNSSLKHLIDEVFLKGDYEIDLPASPVIIDCGANIGVATLFFKYKYPNANLVAIEANSHAFEVLNKNIDKNGLNSVQAIHAVAGNFKTDSEDFYISNKGSLVGSIYKNRGGGQMESSPTIKISDIVNERNQIDLLKLDIEGGEWGVFDDLNENDSFDKVNKMIVEYHHNQNSNERKFSEFLTIIENAGYKYNLHGIHHGRAGIFQDVLIYCEK